VLGMTTLPALHSSGLPDATRRQCDGLMAERTRHVAGAFPRRQDLRITRQRGAVERSNQVDIRQAFPHQDAEIGPGSDVITATGGCGRRRARSAILVRRRRQLRGRKTGPPNLTNRERYDVFGRSASSDLLPV
jgi:hypothetical protein